MQDGRSSRHELQQLTFIISNEKQLQDVVLSYITFQDRLIGDKYLKNKFEVTILTYVRIVSKYDIRT